ncbi:MAG: hypothetical protein ACKVS8_08450 [Phycisphaerales bacterium]
MKHPPRGNATAAHNASPRARATALSAGRVVQVLHTPDVTQAM